MKPLDNGEGEEENAPDFTCTLRNNKYHLHTHAPADHLIYHLGNRNALLGDNPLRKSLSQLPVAASHWKAVQCTRAVIIDSSSSTSPSSKYVCQEEKYQRQRQRLSLCYLAILMNSDQALLNLFQRCCATGENFLKFKITIVGRHVATYVRICVFCGTTF